tara:strand:+ start:3564 stop:4157 length:594 start_codon:yes stop_codon:yes gene_type:complete
MTLPMKGTRLPHMCTQSGKFLDLMKFSEEDVVIDDIAHGLACVNRFGGQAKVPISVAQHSIYVSQLCQGTPFTLQALLHDASEAYIGDMIFMLKRSPEMNQYRKLEEHIQHTIYRKFGCEVEEPPELVAADKLMVEFEAKHGFTPGCFRFDMPGYAFPSPEEEQKVGEWNPWSWKDSKQAFLRHFTKCCVTLGIDHI